MSEPDMAVVRDVTFSDGQMEIVYEVVGGEHAGQRLTVRHDVIPDAPSVPDGSTDDQEDAGPTEWQYAGETEGGVTLEPQHWPTPGGWPADRGPGVHPHQPKPRGVTGEHWNARLLRERAERDRQTAERGFDTEKPPTVMQYRGGLYLGFDANPGAARVFQRYAESGRMWEDFGTFADGLA
jgi:hypothetical protein